MSKDWTPEEIQAASRAMKEAGHLSYEEFCQELRSVFSIGDTVRIRPEWRDHPEKPAGIHVVINVNEITRRCIIQAQDTGLSIAPCELVGFDMIEKV